MIGWVLQQNKHFLSTSIITKILLLKLNTKWQFLQMLVAVSKNYFYVISYTLHKPLWHTALPTWFSQEQFDKIQNSK